MKTKQPRQRRKNALDRFHELLAEIERLHAAKNFDYAGGGQQGPLGNFNRGSALIRAYPASESWSQPSGVAITYMLKQFDAALILMTTGKTSRTGEGLRQRWLDIACYAIIIMQLLEQEEK